MNPLDIINKRLDVIEQKLGIQSQGQSQMPQEKYMALNSDGKDAVDAQQILGKT